MSKVLGRGAIIHLVLAIVHVAINMQLNIDQQIPMGWIAGIYAVLYVASAGSLLLATRFKPDSGSAANIFLMSSMAKFFVVILFLVVMIKLSGVANRIVIAHFMGPYFLALFLQTRGFVKHLKK